ncbi:MAG: cell division protein FtsQ/DivIB [Geminicoccaceae bacterium]
MRPVTATKARAKRTPPRKRPMPTWLKRFAWSVVAVLIVLVAGTGISIPLRNGAIASLGHSLNQELMGLSRHANLVVASVQVSGAARTPKASILETLNVDRKTPILDVDIDAARAKLASLPWVREVSVRRILPGTLAVSIQEHEPVAVRHDAEGEVLMGGDGAAIRIADLEPFDRLPRVVGSGDAETVRSLIKAIGANRDLAGQLKALEWVDGRLWVLTMATGVAVILPEADPYQGIRTLATLESQHRVLSKALVQIDLRLADRAVITPML